MTVTICQAVLCFPSFSRAARSPLLAASRRRPVMRNSRLMMTIAAHAGMACSGIEADERRCHQHLVRERIHELAEVGDEIARARDLAVEIIRDVAATKSTRPAVYPQLQVRNCGQTASGEALQRHASVIDATKPSGQKERATVRRFGRFMQCSSAYPSAVRGSR